LHWNDHSEAIPERVRIEENIDDPLQYGQQSSMMTTNETFLPEHSIPGQYPETPSAIEPQPSVLEASASVVPPPNSGNQPPVDHTPGTRSVVNDQTASRRNRTPVSNSSPIAVSAANAAATMHGKDHEIEPVSTKKGGIVDWVKRKVNKSEHEEMEAR
jgi:hypothetical protein